MEKQHASDRGATEPYGILTELASRYAKLFTYRHHQHDRERWDTEYASDQWQMLHQIQELHHYSLIVGYCHFLKPGGSILDLGCGTGILRERLCPQHYSYYVGIDFSETAIRQAASQTTLQSSFILADVETFETDKSFDVIVFNECLYYFKNPLALIDRFTHNLAHEGIFVVSMYHENPTLKIWRNQTGKLWRLLERHYTIKDAVCVCHMSGLKWTIKVLTPQRSI